MSDLEVWKRPDFPLDVRFVSAAWEVVKLQSELIEHLGRPPRIPTVQNAAWLDVENELRRKINRALAAMKASHPVINPVATPSRDDLLKKARAWIGARDEFTWFIPGDRIIKTPFGNFRGDELASVK